MSHVLFLYQISYKLKGARPLTHIHFPSAMASALSKFSASLLLSSNKSRSAGHTKKMATIYGSQSYYKESIPMVNQLRSLPVIVTEDYTRITHVENIEKLKNILLRVEHDPLQSMLTVDYLQKLGIDYHFKEEMEAMLTSLHAHVSSNESEQITSDLFRATLSFHLLREAGYPVTPDVLVKFTDKEGRFKSSLSREIQGLLSLYEASHLNIGEEMLHRANEFSSKHLESCIGELDPNDAIMANHAMKHPCHTTISRYNSAYYLDYCKKGYGIDGVIEEFARLDFNMVQSLHKIELKEILRWWKSTGLADELTLAMNQPVKWFLWPMTMLPEPQFSHSRIQLTKIFAFIYIIDDIFDIYGSPDELNIFTDAISKWDLSIVETLPTYMQSCYIALYNITNEIAQTAYKEHGWSPINSLKKSWTRLCNAFLVESRWLRSRHIPKADEYLGNAVITSGVHTMLIHAFFLLGEGITEANVDFLESNPAIMSCPATILRLWDDLGSAKDENQEGFDGSYVNCYMKENHQCSTKNARDHVKQIISGTWQNLNKECFQRYHFAPTLVTVSLNFARMIEVMYRYVDNQNLPILEDYINVGFDALYFSRIDYQDREKRKILKNLEVIWRGSKSLGSSADIFTGIFPKNYEPPPGGFYFEINDASPVIQDDPFLFDYNVEERVNDFVAAAVAQANITRTNHIMFTMGTDFKYQYAHTWFRQMDKFIHYVNQDGRVNALYSTPSIYTDAKHAAEESWPLKTDDFFPYADRANAYWTGYFTSRPALKGYVRLMSGYYLAARQLEFIKGRNSAGPTTDSLADALAIAQHHDAVSGTEKQHVADDYAKRLSIGYAEAEKLVRVSLSCLTDSVLDSGCSNPKTKFEQCPLLNISYCPPSEVDLSNGKSLVVLVYNSLGWKREDVIRIPVLSKSVAVHDSEGREIESQLLPVVKGSVGLRSRYVKAYLGSSPSVTPKFWLAFPVSTPPLGFSTYIISTAKTMSSAATLSTAYSSRRSKDSITEVGPGELKVSYNGKEGKLSYYSNTRNSVKASMEQSYSYYAGDSGRGSDPQASGAYIFRPNGTFPIKPKAEVSSTILRGPILDEVHQQINPWIYQITRVFKTKEHAEIEFVVGPIPIDDGIGKEVVTQITTTMVTNKTFYTDSSGRDFLKRIRDYRSDWDLQVNQPVAGNYYPINLGIYIEDDNKELSILVDRSMGGSSIVDGQIELMLHRRLLYDDGRGVAEALNEIVCVNDDCEGLTVQGKFYLRIDPRGEGAKWRRSFGQEIYSPLLLAFSEQDGGNWMNSHVGKFSAMPSSFSLPDNVALLTLQALEDGSALLRLAHLYEVGEDKDLSVMASVELKKMFAGKKISKITETNLSANQGRAEMEKKKLKWKVEGTQSSENIVRGGPVDPSKLVVELGPMEIRTFVVNFDYILLQVNEP